MQPQPMEPWQRKRIFQLASMAGLDKSDITAEDRKNKHTLHKFVQKLTGKTSIRELTYSEAYTVIKALSPEDTPPPKGYMSNGQRKRIMGLAIKAGWVDEHGKPDDKRLLDFIKREYKVDAYRFVTVYMASDMIEAFKNISGENKIKKNKEAG